MTVLGVDHFSVSCRDLEASLRFYHELLGIPVRERGELRNGSAAEMLGEVEVRAHFADLDLGEHRTLELLQFVDPESARPTTSAGTPGHLALRVDNADSMYRRLAEAGFPPLGAKPSTIAEPGFWNGARAFYVADPDRFLVELIAWP